jgi:hypothetical protein
MGGLGESALVEEAELTGTARILRAWRWWEYAGRRCHTRAPFGPARILRACCVITAV